MALCEHAIAVFYRKFTEQQALHWLHTECNYWEVDEASTAYQRMALRTSQKMAESYTVFSRNVNSLAPIHPVASQTTKHAHFKRFSAVF